MDDVKALKMVNDELARLGRPPLILPDVQRRAAYNTLVEYVHVTGRSFETAVADLVRFQLNGEALEEIRSMN